MVRMDEERPHVSILRISYCESYDLVLDLDNPATAKNLEMLAIVAFGDDREDEPILAYRKPHSVHRRDISDGGLSQHSSYFASTAVSPAAARACPCARSSASSCRTRCSSFRSIGINS